MPTEMKNPKWKRLELRLGQRCIKMLRIFHHFNASAAEAVNRPGNPPASLTLRAPAELQHLRLSAGNKKEKKKNAICANCTDLHRFKGPVRTTSPGWTRLWHLKQSMPVFNFSSQHWRELKILSTDVWSWAEPGIHWRYRFENETNIPEIIEEEIEDSRRKCWGMFLIALSYFGGVTFLRSSHPKSATCNQPGQARLG